MEAIAEIKIPNFIEKLFGDKLNNIPILDIGDKMGSTGYIDFIDCTYLNNCKIMKGIDRCNRSFITFMVEKIKGDKIPLYRVITLFQR